MAEFAQKMFSGNEKPLLQMHPDVISYGSAITGTDGFVTPWSEVLER